MLPLRVWHWRLDGGICRVGQRDIASPYADLEAWLHVLVEWASGVSCNLARRSGTVTWEPEGVSGRGQSLPETLFESSRAGATIGRADEWSPLVCNLSGLGDSGRDPEEKECCTPLDLPQFGRTS